MSTLNATQTRQQAAYRAEQNKIAQDKANIEQQIANGLFRQFDMVKEGAYVAGEYIDIDIVAEYASTYSYKQGPANGKYRVYVREMGQPKRKMFRSHKDSVHGFSFDITEIVFTIANQVNWKKASRASQLTAAELRTQNEVARTNICKNLDISIYNNTMEVSYTTGHIGVKFASLTPVQAAIIMQAAQAAGVKL